MNREQVLLGIFTAIAAKKYKQMLLWTGLKKQPDDFADKETDLYP